MNEDSLFKPTKKIGGALTSDKMVVNILANTTIGLIVIAVAVGIIGKNFTSAGLLTFAALICASVTPLARRGLSTPGRILVPGLLTIIATFIAFSWGGLYHIAVTGFPVIIVLAGLLLGIHGSFWFALASSIAAIFLGYADINGITPYPAAKHPGYDDVIVAVVIFFSTASILRVIIRRLTESLYRAEAVAQDQEKANFQLQQLQKELELRVEHRTNELQERAQQLQTIAQVSQIIAGIQNLDELLLRVTNLISLRFNVYHTGIFLVDERGEYAVLKAANSIGGQKMLARGHRLRVGSQGIVGFVTSTGNPNIALDVGEDAVLFDNPDLPDTHSEIALPLKVAGQTFGVLDIQSTQPDAFGQEDIQTLSILADQVAIAIQNARSFEQSRDALHEAEGAYRQMTGQAWNQVMGQKKVLGFEYDGATAKPLEERIIDEPSLNIPIRLRGQTIGNFKLITQEETRNWSDDELTIAQAVAERTALTLETARLLEESQRYAARERTIGEITTSVSSSTDMEEILRNAVQELGRRMGGAEVVLELGADEESS